MYKFVKSISISIRSLRYNSLLFMSDKINQNNPCHEPQQSQPKDIKKKSYIMPEKKPSELPHKPSKPLTYVNGRCLIYRSRQNLLTPYIISLHYTVPMIYLAVLIKNNPFYLTFPAALPIMLFTEIFIFLRYIVHKGQYMNHIQRVYLLSNGLQVEFILSNKIRRALKNKPDAVVYICNQLISPIQKQDQSYLKGYKFPTSINQIDYPTKMAYGWTKYLKNRDLIYIIPAQFEYIDWEMMIAAMNGKVIDPTDCILEGDQQLMKKPAPTLQQQQKLAQQKLKKEKKEQ